MTARQYSWSDTAFHLADASLDATMSNFRVANFNSVASTPMGSGTYWTEVTPQPALGSDVYEIIGHGRDESIERELETIVETTPFSVFQFPAFGDKRLDINGGGGGSNGFNTDSYNSNIGPYDPATAGDNGDLGTNATSNIQLPGPTNDEGIFISGSVDVQGEVWTGTGSDSENVAFIQPTGDTLEDVSTGGGSAMYDPLLLPPVIVPLALALTCTDLIVETDDPVALPAVVTISEDKCYNNVSVKNGVLNITTGVKIYVTTSFQITTSPFPLYVSLVGNAADPSASVPANAIFQFTSGVSEAKIAGNTQFYGAIYAPDTDFKLSGNVDIYGSVTADTIRSDGTVAIHYDEALADVEDPIGGYRTEVFYWRERDLSE
ncbi:MAG: hypothetical protein Q8R78_01540, partial [Candidatus Omnitrophota bacterium]|nr:hypothetical protein [Candidatus Omnitrophota bacterium]